MWGKFCRAVGHEELLQDPRFTTIPARTANTEVINGLVSEWAREKTVAEVVAILERAEVPVAPVHSIAQAANDPHLWERKMLVEMEDKESGRTFVPGLTVKFSDTPGAIGPIPRPGEHNQEVYCDLLGYDTKDLAQWQDEGVI